MVSRPTTGKRLYTSRLYLPAGMETYNFLAVCKAIIDFMLKAKPPPPDLCIKKIEVEPLPLMAEVKPPTDAEDPEEKDLLAGLEHPADKVEIPTPVPAPATEPAPVMMAEVKPPPIDLGIPLEEIEAQFAPDIPEIVVEPEVELLPMLEVAEEPAEPRALTPTERLALVARGETEKAQAATPPPPKPTKVDLGLRLKRWFGSEDNFASVSLMMAALVREAGYSDHVLKYGVEDFPKASTLERQEIEILGRNEWSAEVDLHLRIGGKLVNFKTKLNFGKPQRGERMFRNLQTAARRLNKYFRR
ncbi:MAG: hypothetical protein WC764_03565 [Candidatus Paceibacterota bacterium]